MDKLDMKSKDIISDNIKIIEELFPNTIINKTDVPVVIQYGKRKFIKGI